MQVIISRPFDDNNIAEVYLVDHDEKSRDFVEDWNSVLEQVKKNNPDEWAVDQIIEILEKNGWQLIRPNIEEVTY